MQDKTHFVSHFIPGILLGVVVGFAFGAIMGEEALTGIKSSALAAQTVQGACDAPGAQVTFVTSDNGKKTTVYLDGKTAFFKIFSDPHTPTIFEQTNKNAYITFEGEATGEYAPYGGAGNLYRIDLCTRDVVEMWNNDRQDDKGYVLDVGPNENALVLRQYVAGDANLRLNIFDMRSKTSSTYTLPSPMFKTFDAKFSPDSTKIAIAAATGDTDDERSVIYVFDRIEKVFERRTTQIEGSYFTLTGWINNETIDYK